MDKLLIQFELAKCPSPLRSINRYQQPPRETLKKLLRVGGEGCNGVASHPMGISKVAFSTPPPPRFIDGHQRPPRETVTWGKIWGGFCDRLAFHLMGTRNTP